jgi:hypothetical protein
VHDGVPERAQDALAVRGASRIPHSGRSLLDHLTGTYAVLRAWGQTDAVCLAGLFHSCYGTDAFAPALFRAAERDAVRAVIGAEAEHLAHVFGLADRRAILRRFMHDASTGGDDGPAIAVVEMANHAEQMSCGASGEVAGLAYVSRLGARLRGGWREVPPVFDGCRVELSQAAERRAQMCYLAARHARAAASEAARGLFAEAVRVNPWVAEPRIGLAQEALRDGDRATAATEAARAAAELARWGTAWDKTASFEAWGALTRRISRLAEESAIGAVRA